MIGPLHLAQSGTFNGYNPLFCPCYCDKEEPDLGGEQFDNDRSVNPFMKMKPVPGIEYPNTQNSPQTYVTLPDVDHGQEDVSTKVAFKMLKRGGLSGRYPKVSDEQKASFEKYLQQEEDAYLLLLMAADEDDCCDC